MSELHVDLEIAQFDYELPAELIAKEPPAERDASRLMVIDRPSQTLEHRVISELPELLRPQDLVVVNNTRVIPARFHAVKQGTGGRVEFLLLHRGTDGVWAALAKPAKSLRRGTQLQVASRLTNPVEIEVVEAKGEGEFAVRFIGGDDIDLDLIGQTPLPPYLRGSQAPAERYQTVYASVPGSAAAPTAGLHLTDRLRKTLRRRGVGWAEITLHIGLDTFRPVTVERLADHRIHREWASLSGEVASAIYSTKESGGRVVAVGTTSARTLEAWGKLPETQRAFGLEGWMDVFITPGYEWRIVDGLLTNFHLPRSTLIVMVSAFAGIDLIKHAYLTAVERRYRFYSFGDAMIIL